MRRPVARVKAGGNGEKHALPGHDIVHSRAGHDEHIGDAERRDDDSQGDE